MVCRLLSSCGARDPEHEGSVVVAYGLSCLAACGILVPRPGIEPASPALEGGFLTAGPPGKSPFNVLICILNNKFLQSSQAIHCLCTAPQDKDPGLL